MHYQIKEILNLTENWFSETEGRPFRETDLRVASRLATFLDEKKIKVYIYPHPENEISFEFDQFKPELPSLTLRFTQQEIVCHSYNLETKQSKRTLFSLSEVEFALTWILKYKEIL